MMADFDLMELAPEQQEDLAYLHQQLFSTATEVVTAGGGGGEPTMIVTETTTAAATTTNVDMVHDVIDFTEKYGNGNTATEPTETEKPAVYHGEGESLVGRSIVKKFKRTKYAGKVISFDAECKWYKVEYEDGDEEELEYKELEALLVEAGEAEAVRAANVKKSKPETDSDTKSPAKRGRGRPSGVKTPAKEKAEKKATAPKSPKSPKTPKASTPKKPSPKKAEGEVSEEKKSETPNTGEKRGRGRPRKDGSAAKPKADGKTSGDSSSESKPSTRKSASAQDQGESRTGRSPRGKAAATPSVGGPLSQKEGVQLIGSKTKKDFSGTLYDGEVIGYDPKMSYYKVLYSDGDKEDLTLIEVRATLVEDQTTPKTRGRSKSADPAKSDDESPSKKQKVSTPKKDAAKAQSPARDGSQPRKRGRPAKARR